MQFLLLSRYFIFIFMYMANCLSFFLKLQCNICRCCCFLAFDFGRFYVVICVFFIIQDFPFNFECQTLGNYWYHFYNVFGMTRSLTGGLNPGPLALEASTLPLGYQGGGLWLGIETGTSRTRSQHSSTRLSRRRFNSFQFWTLSRLRCLFQSKSFTITIILKTKPQIL